MSLKFVNIQRTLCEVLREINDELQGSELHPVILPKLKEAEQMGKRMSKALYRYNRHYDAGWWEQNAEYEKLIRLRHSKNYIT